MRTQPAPTATDPQEDRGTAIRGPASRRWLVTCVGLPVLAVAVLAAVQPAIVTGTLGSPRALLILAGIIAANIGWSALLRHRVASESLRTVLVLAPIAVVLALYVAPYFAPDQVVDEAFPVALAATEQTDTDQADQADPDQITSDPASTPSASRPGATAEASTDAASPTTPAPTAPAASQVTPATPPATPPPAAPTGPIELSRGSFVGLDNHYANGQAAIYELEDGSRIVRLEDVDLQRVPDARVYLVPAAEATSPIEGSVTLGPLTGNVGSSNYTIPADVDLAGPLTVLVWCEPFASPVGAASQA